MSWAFEPAIWLDSPPIIHLAGVAPPEKGIAMCRFVLYLGPNLSMDRLITKPVNSIIHQSFKSQLREEPLNGDGFGVAWFVPELSPYPALFRSIQPAWNNINLRHLARVTRSHCIMAHVRAATPGLAVSETNCHPFAAGRFAFMHNGYISEFGRVKRAICERLSDAAYDRIEGSTDSELLFALAQDKLELERADLTIDQMADAIAATIHETVSLLTQAEVVDHSRLNLVLTDGRKAVVTRFASGDHEANTLFVHSGSRYVCEGGQCRMMKPDPDDHTVIIASEPLSDDPGWREVPRNHMVLVESDLSTTVRPIRSPAQAARA